jgi:hypothetical protein
MTHSFAVPLTPKPLHDPAAIAGFSEAATTIRGIKMAIFFIVTPGKVVE